MMWTAVPQRRCQVRARFGQETTEMPTSAKYAASKLDWTAKENAGENGDVRR
jgi:hypothetical protein